MSNNRARQMDLHVIVIGGGIGGLGLAQGLKKAGISVAVYERDSSVYSRTQGYRISINSEGSQALYSCLPENFYQLYLASSTRLAVETIIAVYDEQLNQRFYKALPVFEPDITRIRTAVNRMTLREVLLSELEGAVHFGKALARFEQLADARVRAYFTDSTSAEGDLLVAADGTNSLVRQALVPQARIEDLGHVVIYGKTPLTPELERAVPVSFLVGMTRIMGRGNASLGVGAYRKQEPFATATAKYAPTAQLTDIPDYLMWILDSPVLQQANTEGKLQVASGAKLYEIVREMIKDWHPVVRQLVKGADTEATFLVNIRSAEFFPAWPTTNVTFLGDAIHTMTPARGEGANTALRDAALLSNKLKEVVNGDVPLLQALAEYETEMLRYGFKAVAAARESAIKVHKGESLLGF